MSKFLEIGEIVESTPQKLAVISPRVTSVHPKIIPPDKLGPPINDSKPSVDKFVWILVGVVTLCIVVYYVERKYAKKYNSI